MLFLMVESFSKDGIKIGLFPIEFIKKSFFEKCQKLDEIKWTKGGDPPPSVHLIIRGDWGIFQYWPQILKNNQI